MTAALDTATPSQVDEARRALLADIVTQWHELQSATSGAPVGEAVAAVETLRDNINTMQRRLANLDAEYTRRGGWNQYYRHVKSGRVHMDNTCHTTFPRTQWDWLTDLSGADAAQVAADTAGPTCRVCFAERSAR